MSINITNPMEEKDIIPKIIDCYCAEGDFYNALTHCGSHDKVYGRCNLYYRDQLALFLFNKWKRVMLHYAETVPSDHPYYHKLRRLASYLNVRNPQTAEGVSKIMDYEAIPDKELSEALDVFRWNQVGEFSSWCHIDSSYVLYNTHKREKTEHRLYINCDSDYTHQIIYEFLRKCHERHIRYYFKYELYGSRDDTIVFYCDSKHLPLYAEILREVKEENNLSSHIHKPPLLTGKIDGWLGYGSEPQEENGKVVHSFTSKRSEHLSKCIREETTRWIEKNLALNYHYQGKKVSYEDYIIMRMIEYKRKYLLSYITDTPAQLQYRGYSRADVASDDFTFVMYHYLKGHFSDIMKYLRTANSKFNCKIRFKNGDVPFGDSDLLELLKEQTKFMSGASSKYQEELRKRIERTASSYEISSNNYAFDISKEQLLKGVHSVQETSSIKNENYHVVREKKSGYRYQPMTDEEIEESRKKIGF